MKEFDVKQNFNKNIQYLEYEDFKFKNGEVILDDKYKKIPTNIPVLIMIQKATCPPCKRAKPIFQKFANLSIGKVFCLTIEDSEHSNDSEKELIQNIQSIYKEFRGFPSFIVFKNKKLVKTEQPNLQFLSIKLLQEFCII